MNTKQEVWDEAELKRKQKQKWLTMESEDADEKTDARTGPSHISEGIRNSEDRSTFECTNKIEAEADDDRSQRQAQ
jgi:hypothetical protein